jgi:hypothetical protein
VTNVFISDRRDDAAGHAGRLSDRLVTRLGASRVFMDVQDIQPGQNFAQAIVTESDSSAAMPNLAYGTWTLRLARDEEGKSWDNSVLQFTSQEKAPDGLMLRGRFTWRLDNVLMGTEEFAGRYVERTRQVILEGNVVTDAKHDGPLRLAVGSYSAVLAPDERALMKGRWGSTARNEPGYAGEWEAVR